MGRKPRYRRRDWEQYEETTAFYCEVSTIYEMRMWKLKEPKTSILKNRLNHHSRPLSPSNFIPILRFSFLFLLLLNRLPLLCIHIHQPHFPISLQDLRIHHKYRRNTRFLSLTGIIANSVFAARILNKRITGTQ